jgi:rhamnopyranosyl-N-acetylglucosaminyl-diphospho-decaprenol beta-1,3/1,4-galactofuranosyltransferase
MGLSIASVTVAYNDAKVLPRQMEALSRQTRPLQEIVVVDNASVDGSRALLAENYPEVTVLGMSENLGWGGAMGVGLTYAAIEKRHDWVLMFDADSVPDAHALAGLVQGIHSLQDKNGEVGMAAPVCVHRRTGTRYPPLFWQNGFVNPPAELFRQPIWFADLVMGSGCMVRRDVVEKIGVPRADFFVCFPDYEYCLRARAHGYKIAVITQSELAHEVGEARQVRLPGFSGLWSDHAPWHEYYVSRNITYTVWWLYPNAASKWFVIRHLVRHAGGAILFGSNKIACLKKMAQGFWDGRRGVLGIRFRPDAL